MAGHHRLETSMGIPATNRVIRRVRQLAREDERGRTDGELLSAFVQTQDAGALAALVERHGPMVWGVCRRLLRAHPDAEDAFQATFLVLVRKAASVRDRDAVANWLYGVARQTAIRVRATRAKRRRREGQMADVPEPAAEERAVHDDVLPVLDEELARLPDKYRVLIVLCDLEGKSRKDVARQLGCPEGTVGGRLARARVMLADRLGRRGVTVSGGALAAALAEAAAAATVPAAVLKAAIAAASLHAAGTAAGVISVEVAALTHGVLKAMLVAKLKAAAAVLCLAFALSGLGAGLIAGRSAAAAPGDGVKTSGAADRPVVPVEPIQTKRVYQIGDDELPKMLRDPGTRFDVAVTGRTEGVCSGTDLYFYDSDLDVAAVHAGLIHQGEKAVVTVTVVKCPESEPGSTRHGVKSARWDGAKVTDTAFLLQKRPAGRGEKPVAEGKSDKAPPKIDLIGAGETAMELLKSTKDADAKWMAVRILGNLQYERAVPLLLESLADPHHHVRANAARALGDMKVAAAAEPLTELLKKEANGGVIQQASLALANLGCADALPALKGAAKHEDVQTRMWVLQAVGRLGGKRDVAFLAGYLDDPSQSVQASAAQGIEQITGADFGFPRRSGPSSPEEGLRRARAWWAEHKGEYERR